VGILISQLLAKVGSRRAARSLSAELTRTAAGHAYCSTSRISPA
jgi:hypothetical protein